MKTIRAVDIAMIFSASRKKCLAPLIDQSKEVPGTPDRPAIPLIRRTLHIHQERFGEEHPDVARDQFNLALALIEIDAYAEAEKLLRQDLVIAIRLGG